MADANHNRVELRTLLVSALGTSLAAWDIAFNFAIHGTVFYDRLMAIWVIATVILLAMLLSGQRSVLGRQGIMMLLIPTGWFIFFALSPNFATAPYAAALWIAAMVLFIASIGYILSVLAWMLDDHGVTLSADYRNRLLAIVLIITMAGYLTGRNHRYFVSCTQFQIAGDVVPDDCRESEFWQDR